MIEPDEEADPSSPAAGPSSAPGSTRIDSIGVTGDQRARGTTARPLGLRLAEHQSLPAKPDKRKQCADVGQIGERADIPNAGWDADRQARDPGADVRRAEFRMDARKNVAAASRRATWRTRCGPARIGRQQRRNHAHQRARPSRQRSSRVHADGLRALWPPGAALLQRFPMGDARQHQGHWKHTARRKQSA